MADSPRKRYSQSPSPFEEQPRSRSRSWSRPRGRSKSKSKFRDRGRSDVGNSETKLCVTGLSTRVTETDLEDHFSREGKANSPRKRESRSPSPYGAKSRSRSRSWSRPRGRSRSRSRSRDRGRFDRSDVGNSGTTLYVTGLSTRVTDRDLEDHFSREGKVASCFLVVEPRTRASRGFAFITMATVDDASRCVKHLHQTVLDGRCITVERSRRKRPRTPTPGHYLGLKNTRDNDNGSRGDRGRYRGGRDDYGYHRSPRRSPLRGGRDYSPRRSPYGGRSRRERSRSLPYSPYGSSDRNYAYRSR